ncbi:MAG: CDGSH iron-sulfur domain-containing protein [Waterburya sp.]
MSDTTIQVKDNGPFLVKGDVAIVDAEGQTFSTQKNAIALCRCTASTNKPFCDGTHAKIGFDSAERAAE